MSGIYPTDWMNHEANLKQHNDERQSRLLYWQRLRQARAEYADEIGADPLTQVSKTYVDDFSKWMQNKYGIQLEFNDGNITGAYRVTNEKKLMMFVLKYPK